MSLSIPELNQFKKAPIEGMEPLLANRWSPRAFKETPVKPADLRLILEAARWTASSSNLQPWRFIVGVRGTEAYDKIFATLVPFNQSWAGKAGVLLLGFSETANSKGEPNAYALYDLGQAAATLVAQATALGLHAHSMGGFDHEAASKTFGLEKGYALGAVIAIGYQDEPSSITNEQMQQREVAPRERKPLKEIALTALGTPFEG